jgi:hypothetical protein
MASTRPNLTLQQTINQIERVLDVVRPMNDDEVKLRLRIEEALEFGYEAMYARPVDCKTGIVLPFSSRATARD